MPNKLLTHADCWRLTIILIGLGLFLAISPAVGIRVEWASLTPVFAMAALLSLIGVVYRFLGRDDGIAATTLIVAQIVIYANVAVLDNYLGLEARRPLVDATLARADAALGVDWWGYVNWIKSDPLFGRFLTLAYLSSLPQVAFAIVVLGFTRRFERLDNFTLAFMLSSAITIGVWTIFPSFGALPLHYAQGLPEPPFELAMSRAEALKLLSLHATPPTTLRMDEFTGLIGCPSFHTALAILSSFALWGIRFVGKPVVLLNVFVFASIPADGGHHFVDMAAGVAITVLSIYIARAMLRSGAEPVAANTRKTPIRGTIPA